jgi:RimJ/RimL family protein N-acetyltransferase
VAFTSPTIDRVEIRCDPLNAASARVPQRLGYDLTGLAAAEDGVELQVWQLSREEFVRQHSFDS